jgi:predicted nucleic acid-binding protein
MADSVRTGTLVDANVLLDIFTDDSEWADWSSGQLADALDRSEVLINPIVYAEISVGFDRIEDLEDALPGDISREALPWEAAFLAGKAFLAYRRGGGKRRWPLPDFYVGAHAAVTGRALLTRDEARYRTLFPRLALIAP